jgi:hypothetical protein
LATFKGTGFFLFLVFVAIGGSVLIALALRKSPMQMKFFTAFSCLIVASALISPMSYDPLGIPKWQLVAEASAVRYWFFPSLVFLWSLVIGLQRGSMPLKAVCAVLLVLLCFGVALRWRRTPFFDTHYPELARSFESAPAGTVKIFPQNPDGWTFQLVKRAHN